MMEVFNMDAQKERKLLALSASIRLNALETVYRADSGHIGGSLSVIDILTILYFDKMNILPKNPHWEDRDRLVLSKGHCTPALYSVLAKRGYFPESELENFRDIDSMLSGHAEMHVPGVDMSTGSLGQGLSAAVGMALNGQLDNKDYRVYAIVGDGELEEGQIWEAAMCAAHYKLSNLVAIVDNNNLQIDGTIEEIMSPYPIDQKFAAFGWNVMTVDGHDFAALEEALAQSQLVSDRPTAIIAKTVKGKGISFMENVVDWHGQTPDEGQYLIAKNELMAKLEEMEGYRNE